MTSVAGIAHVIQKINNIKLIAELSHTGFLSIL